MSDIIPLLAGEEDSTEIRILLVGKTGVGKSAVGNTILGREAFRSECSPSTVTQQCEKRTGEVSGRSVAVIDTPGLFDTDLSNDEVIREILTCVSLTSPGPHVFLVVIQLGRFTQEEKDTVKLIQKTFGERAADYTMVLFTQGDRLRGRSIEDFLCRSDDLKQFVSQCGNRYNVFNNENPENRSQVTELLEKIEGMVERNGGGCFTNDLYPKAERAIREEQERILRERKPEISRQEELEREYSGEELEKKKREIWREEEKKARKQAERNNSFLRKLGIVAGAGVGAAGIGAGIAAGVEIGAAVGLLGGPIGIAVGASAGLAAGAAAGAVIVNREKIKEVAEKCSVQ